MLHVCSSMDDTLDVSLDTCHIYYNIIWSHFPKNAERLQHSQIKWFSYKFWMYGNYMSVEASKQHAFANIHYVSRNIKWTCPRHTHVQYLKCVILLHVNMNSYQSENAWHESFFSILLFSLCWQKCKTHKSKKHLYLGQTCHRKVVNIQN